MTADVSLREAAERLTAAGDPVERSTLSRYVAAHADALAPRKAGKHLLIDYDVLAAYRRRHLGKLHKDTPNPAQPTRKPDPGSLRASLCDSGLSLADERLGKLRADRQLRVLALRDRLAALVPRDLAVWFAWYATKAFRFAAANAAQETAADLASRFGGDPEPVDVVLYRTGRAALDTFTAVLHEAGFGWAGPEAPPVADLLGAFQAGEVDVAILDEARAAKAQIDRQHKELTLAERNRLLVPRHQVDFATVDALVRARIKLAEVCRDGALREVAELLAVEEATVRFVAKLFERNVLSRFNGVLRRSNPQIQGEAP